MDGLLAYVADRLGLKGAEARQDVHVRRGLMLDGELRVPGHRYLIEGTWGVARWEHVSQLSFAVRLLGIDSESRNEKVTGVLVASAIPDEVREAVESSKLDLMTMTAPAELLGHTDAGRDPVLLTKPKSWAVVVGLLQQDAWPNIRALAEATAASRSWTQVVVSDLARRGIVEQRRGRIALADPGRLMDRIASERPLRRFRSSEVATGIDSWEELQHFMAQQWSPTIAKMERPGLWACGPTAAMAYTNYMARHDRFHAYTESPEAVKTVFEGRKGGIPIVLYKPDRPMGPTATTWNDIHVTGLPQTILDMMGTGFSGRDTTKKLLEVLRV